MRGSRLRASAVRARTADVANPSVQIREMPGELAVRLRVLRRARRDAQTRASRVRRVLLAPTVPAGAGETYTRPSKSLHRD